MEEGTFFADDLRRPSYREQEAEAKENRAAPNNSRYSKTNSVMTLQPAIVNESWSNGYYWVRHGSLSPRLLARGAFFAERPQLLVSLRHDTPACHCERGLPGHEVD
jgi:hypothetical protein